MEPANRTGSLSVVSWDLFIRHAADALECEPAHLNVDVALFDLGIDSVAVVELLLSLEELGATVPDELNVGTQTLRSLYSVCVELWLSLP